MIQLWGLRWQLALPKNGRWSAYGSTLPQEWATGKKYPVIPKYYIITYQVLKLEKTFTVLKRKKPPLLILYTKVVNHYIR